MEARAVLVACGIMVPASRAMARVGDAQRSTVVGGVALLVVIPVLGVAMVAVGLYRRSMLLVTVGVVVSGAGAAIDWMMLGIQWPTLTSVGAFVAGVIVLGMQLSARRSRMSG